MEPTHKKTAFVVDDEIPLPRVHAIAATSAGYSATPFSDPEIALKSMQEIESLDLLVTDGNMSPKMHGIELAKAAKARFPELYVLLITATRHEVLEHSDYNPELGGTGIAYIDQIVEKPIEMKALVPILQEIYQKS